MTCRETHKLFDSIMDCEATETEKNRFIKHLDKCISCFDQYELEKIFKEYIQKNDKKTCCPPELIEIIKNQINDLT